MTMRKIVFVMQRSAEFATESTKATKGNENLYGDSFVLVASFVVNPGFICCRGLWSALRGEHFPTIKG